MNNRIYCLHAGETQQEGGNERLKGRIFRLDDKAVQRVSSVILTGHRAQLLLSATIDVPWGDPQNSRQGDGDYN